MMRGHWLECRIPPPLVGLLLAAGMYGVAGLGGESLSLPLWLSWPLLVAGILLDMGAIRLFVMRHTTVNPLRPESSSALVVNGFYRISRNPMYLGMLCFLLAWVVYLQQWLPLLGPLCFVLWINRFQIMPEERALAARFGGEYLAYCRKVRRWC